MEILCLGNYSAYRDICHGVKTSSAPVVRDGRLFTAGHRFIKKHTLKNGNGKLTEAGDMLEVLDSLGEPKWYVIDGDMVCFPGDSLVIAKYDEWAEAEVLSFSPIR